MSTSFWICALVTLANALTSLGFSFSSYKTTDKKAQVNSMYTIARSLSLVIICLVPIFNHSASWLIAAALSMIIVQAADTIIGIKIKDTMKAIGPGIVCLLNLVVLLWYLN